MRIISSFIIVSTVFGALSVLATPTSVGGDSIMDAFEKRWISNSHYEALERREMKLLQARARTRTRIVKKLLKHQKSSPPSAANPKPTVNTSEHPAQHVPHPPSAPTSPLAKCSGGSPACSDDEEDLEIPKFGFKVRTRKLKLIPGQSTKSWPTKSS